MDVLLKFDVKFTLCKLIKFDLVNRKYHKRKQSI